MSVSTCRWALEPRLDGVSIQWSVFNEIFDWREEVRNISFSSSFFWVTEWKSKEGRVCSGYAYCKRRKSVGGFNITGVAASVRNWWDNIKKKTRWNYFITFIFSFILFSLFLSIFFFHFEIRYFFHPPRGWKIFFFFRPRQIKEGFSLDRSRKLELKSGRVWCGRGWRERVTAYYVAFWETEVRQSGAGFYPGMAWHGGGRTENHVAFSSAHDSRSFNFAAREPRRNSGGRDEPRC